MSKSRVKPNKHKQFSSIVSPKIQAISTLQTNNITNTTVQLKLKTEYSLVPSRLTRSTHVVKPLVSYGMLVKQQIKLRDNQTFPAL